MSSIATATSSSSTILAGAWCFMMRQNMQFSIGPSDLFGLIQPNDERFCGKAGLAQLLRELLGTLLSGFVAHAYAVVEAVAAIKALDDDGVKARADPGLQPLGVARVSKGSYLHGVDARLGARASRRRQSQYLQLHARDSRTDHVDGASAGVREVDDAALDEGAAIVDAYRHVTAVVEVVNPHLSVEGEGAMRGRQFVHVIDFAVRGRTVMVRMSVPGGQTLFT